jgi:DNA repair exonuclease SbcCD ATPase subunit
LKVEQQLAELEQEVERVRREKAAASAAREQHEKMLQQVSTPLRAGGRCLVLAFLLAFF